jgi:hypothetical protein
MRPAVAPLDGGHQKNERPRRRFANPPGAVTCRCRVGWPRQVSQPSEKAAECRSSFGLSRFPNESHMTTRGWRRYKRPATDAEASRRSAAGREGGDYGMSAAWTADRRSADRRGLARRPTMLRPPMLRVSSSSRKPEMMSTGICWRTAEPSRAFRNAGPLISGMRRSSRMRSGTTARRRSSASRPFSAVSTRYPARPRVSDQNSRMPLSSSATRIHRLAATTPSVAGAGLGTARNSRDAGS